MKINFEKNINGFQEARKLKMILEHYAQSDISDKPTILMIESVLEDLNKFISDPEFEKFSHSDEMDSSLFEQLPTGNPFLDGVTTLCRSIFGPSKRELLLGKQRQELLERAERAEAMAFEALAETADVGRQRDAALKKLNESEVENS